MAVERALVVGRGSAAQTLMGPDLLVVADELSKNCFQVPTAEDQEVVQHLAACGAHPALRGIAGCPHQLSDSLEALALEDVIEGAGELSVPVTKEEARAPRAPSLRATQPRS